MEIISNPGIWKWGWAYNSATPTTAPHAATATAVHLRVSPGAQSAAGAALDGFEPDEEAEADGWLDKGADEERGAAVEEKESVVLSRVQNFWARLSAEGTLALQLAATQAYSPSVNTLWCERGVGADVSVVRVLG